MSHFDRSRAPPVVGTFGRAVGRVAHCIPLAWGTILATFSARAEPTHIEAPKIHLNVEACLGVSAEETQRIAAIELRAEVLDATEHANEMTRIDVQCEGDGASIQVFDPLTRKSLARAISLVSVAPSARARLLALAAAELVAASWIELESNPDPVLEPDMAAPPRGGRAAARAVIRDRIRASRPIAASSPPPRWQIDALVDTRWFTVDPVALLGVGVRASFDPYRTVGVEVDVLVEHANSDQSLGAVSFDLASLGAALRLRKEMRPFLLHGGPGLRLGFARFAGSPYSTASAVGHDVDGFWAGPIAAVGASYGTSQRLSLSLGLEGGYVFLPVRGIVDGGPGLRADGLLLAANLGAGWIF